jgi:hypothetical protein
MKNYILLSLSFILIGSLTLSVSKATPIEKDKSEIVAKVAKDAPAVAAFEITSVNYSDNYSPEILKAAKAVKNSRVFLMAVMPDLKTFCRSHWQYLDNHKSNYTNNLSRNKGKPIKRGFNLYNPPKTC